MRLRRCILALLLIGLCVEGFAWQRGEADLPPLKNGDLVFQSTFNNQSMAVAVASISPYLHTGVVEMTDSGPVVIEAGKVVRTRRLHDWIVSGIGQRVAVYRYDGLTDAQGLAIVAAAKKYLGLPYDYYFSEGDGGIYCSELDYLAFKDAGTPIGKMEKITDLHINNRFVKRIIEERWQGYPQCKGKGLTFEQCYDVILSGTLITPASIADDSHLRRIFTNYW